MIRYGYAPYIESAMRRFLLGTFEDLLISAVTHPLMVHYLDQDQSMGPSSKVGRRHKNRGLNENLAREVF